MFYNELDGKRRFGGGGNGGICFDGFSVFNVRDIDAMFNILLIF